MPLAQEHSATVESWPSPGIAVLGDATRLRQVLTNLIANAIKYNAAPGRVWLTVDSDIASVRINVTDTGPGIADVDQALEDGYSTVGGLGSGLPATRRLMDEFAIASDPGGTRVVARKWLLPA